MGRRIAGNVGNPGHRTGARRDGEHRPCPRPRAVRASAGAEGFSVVLDTGETLRAAACVLAVGQGQPQLPDRLRDVARHPDCVANLWDLEALQRIDRERRILIFDTRLTTADVIATLVSQGHRGPIEAVSRRGMRPLSHRPFPPTMPRLQGLMQAPFC